MLVEKAFNLYTNPTTTTPARRKKSNRRHPGEGCSDPSAKRARTEDPPTPTPSKEMTPPPGPADQTLPAPTDQNPPTPTNPSPAAQPDKTLVEAFLNSARTSASDRLKNYPDTGGILTVSTGWRSSEEVVAKHAKEIKAAEGRLFKQHKESRVAEAKITKLEEELEKKEESITKISACKERYKEASQINYREANKLQTELEISDKETADLEETNACNLEKYEGAAL
ncbi:uncharacterized protein LOC133799930 [Humulus lupulus]|uniref:uncharacterized protein LOC133799930 n=1 Tax=Humulus lupulus TaxID=3486 RepID=UPI002B417212|nr:uncharacterized protein LOC133799930 [Humulus lupulus]